MRQSINCKASYWNEQKKTSKKDMRTKQKGQKKKKKAKQQLFCKYSCPVENLLTVHSGLEFWSNGFSNKEANKRLLKLQPAIDGWLQREKSAVNLYKNMSSKNAASSNWGSRDVCDRRPGCVWGLFSVATCDWLFKFFLNFSLNVLLIIYISGVGVITF